MSNTGWGANPHIYPPNVDTLFLKLKVRTKERGGAFNPPSNTDILYEMIGHDNFPLYSIARSSGGLCVCMIVHEIEILD